MSPIFFKTLEDIHPWSLAVRSQSGLSCEKCQKTGTITPHGWLYDKSGDRSASRVGKRIICNPSPNYGGCGRTRRLLPKNRPYRIHAPLVAVVIFIQSLVLGKSISLAYSDATDSHESRQAGRWWKALRRQEALIRQDILERGHLYLPESPPSNDQTSQSKQKFRHRFRVLLKTWYDSFSEAEDLCAYFQMKFQRAIISSSK